jgi:hypothetical protein
MSSEPAPQLDFATGEVVTISLPSGSYRTYLMDYRVSNSFTGEIRAQATGLSLHQWLQNATADELAFVGEGVVQRIAMWAAGVRNG